MPFMEMQLKKSSPGGSWLPEGQTDEGMRQYECALVPNKREESAALSSVTASPRHLPPGEGLLLHFSLLFVIM